MQHPKSASERPRLATADRSIQRLQWVESGRCRTPAGCFIDASSGKAEVQQMNPEEDNTEFGGQMTRNLAKWCLEPAQIERLQWMGSVEGALADFELRRWK